MALLCKEHSCPSQFQLNLNLTGAKGWLFPSRSEGGHLTRQRFSQLVKELVQKLNKAEFIAFIKGKYGPDFVKKYLVADFLAVYPYDRALSKVLTKAEVEKLQEKFTKEFENLANKILNLSFAYAKVKLFFAK